MSNSIINSIPFQLSAASIEPFDASRYTSWPHTGATKSVGFMRDLEQSAPTNLRGAAADAFERMNRDRIALERAISRRHATVDGSDLRPTLYILRGLWRCVHTRTRGVAEVTAAIPERAMARECMAVLFPDGADFTGRSSGELLVESEIRLGLLDERSLRAAFTRLNGSWLIDALQAAHAAHAEYAANAHKLSLTVARVPDLSAAMTAARLSTQAYVRWIIAHVDERKPETRAWAEKALAPIEALRQRKRRTPAKDNAEPHQVEIATPSVPAALEPAAPAAPAPAKPSGPPSEADAPSRE